MDTVQDQAVLNGISMAWAEDAWVGVDDDGSGGADDAGAAGSGCRSCCNLGLAPGLVEELEGGRERAAHRNSSSAFMAARCPLDREFLSQILPMFFFKAAHCCTLRSRTQLVRLPHAPANAARHRLAAVPPALAEPPHAIHRLSEQSLGARN